MVNVADDEIVTRSERQTANDGTMLQVEATQEPAFSFDELGQEVQLDDPLAEHVAQVESQDAHADVAVL